MMPKLSPVSCLGALGVLAVIIFFMQQPAVRLSFDGGTIVVRDAEPEFLLRLPGVRHDPRSDTYRAEARFYRAIVEHLLRDRQPYLDEARAYDKTPWTLHTDREPFPHQTEA